MSETKHTPEIEQWEKRRVSLGRQGIYFQIWKVSGVRHEVLQTIVREIPAEQAWLDEDEARVNLATAAPAMLQALRKLLKYLVDENPGGFAIDAYMCAIREEAEAAIKAATEGQ